MLAAVCARLGGDKGSLDEALTKARPDAHNGWTRRGLSPFDYQRRMGAVLADGPEGLTLIVKGAPEAVMEACASAGGAPFDAAARKAALARVHDLASNGLRAVAVASRPWTGAPRDPTPNDETNLVFEGLCTFADPPKASAPAAVARLAAAGVRVVILSGDDPLVVGRLAKIVGLRAQEAIVGADLNVLSIDALRVQTRDTDVFARLSPDQKVRIVHALRAAGEVVGFMGDGVNDAPGIKAADVGLSVDGATGVARAAADMILLESDLAVVADGVEEGRRTFANILKYIRMGASSNFGNMLSMAAASLFLPFLPMLATQILLNNLLYDVSEIGIPFDNVRAIDIAQPQRWRMQDIMRFAAVMGPLSSVFDLVTFGALFLWFRTSPEVFRTGWFVESIATQTLVIFIDPHARASVAGHAQSGPDDHDAGGSGSSLGHPVLAVGRVVRVPGLAAACSHRACRDRGGLSRLRGIVQTPGDRWWPATCSLKHCATGGGDARPVAPTALVARPPVQPTSPPDHSLGPINFSLRGAEKHAGPTDRTTPGGTHWMAARGGAWSE